MYRIGIIGVGFIGRMHFNSYQKLSAEAVVTALCDKEADRRAGDWGNVTGNLDLKEADRPAAGQCQAYADYHELLADPEVDVVDICLPTYLHCEAALAALAAGKHVLCEKPMARTVEQSNTMLKAAAKAKKKKFMIAQCVRFWPEYAYLKQIVDDKRFGALKSLHLRRQSFIPHYSMDNWLMNPQLSGGMILDLHVHDTDFLVYLLGLPKAICARGVCHPQRGVDRVYAHWVYDDNVPVLVEGFWDMPPGFGFNMGFSALFEGAAVQWDCNSGKPLAVFTDTGETRTPELSGDDGYFNELKYFLECIARNEKPAVSTPQQSRDAVALALAEEQAVRTGRPAKLRWPKR